MRVRLLLATTIVMVGCGVEFTGETSPNDAMVGTTTSTTGAGGGGAGTGGNPSAPGGHGGTGGGLGGDGGDVVDGMAPIASATFTMGCAPADSSCESDESPLHEVTVSAFELDLTEVTQQAYDECVVAGACTSTSCSYTPQQTPDLPVVCATWPQATTYCSWARKRLPTEAEWELAARGTDQRLYAWGNDPPDCTRANSNNCSGGLSPVGQYPAGDSPYGVHDMVGNVWEWVSDLYAANYYAVSPAVDPQGADTSSWYVRRGGSWGSSDTFSRSGNRSYFIPSYEGATGGFRCAR